LDGRHGAVRDRFKILIPGKFGLNEKMLALYTLRKKLLETLAYPRFMVVLWLARRVDACEACSHCLDDQAGGRPWTHSRLLPRSAVD
jgi:hypothetical protein